MEKKRQEMMEEEEEAGERLTFISSKTLQCRTIVLDSRNLRRNTPSIPLQLFFPKVAVPPHGDSCLY